MPCCVEKARVSSSSPHTQPVQTQNGEGRSTNLDEGDRVKAVLAGDLEADVVAALGVPGGLGTGLDLAVDLVVVAGSEDAEVVGGGDGRGVGRGGEADGSAVAGDGGLLDVVASLGTGEEALVADDGVDVGSGALQEVEVGAAVEAGLLEVEVELGATGLGGGEEAEDTLGLEALGEVVGELNLGLERVGRVPSLGEGEAWTSIGQKYNCWMPGCERKRERRRIPMQSRASDAPDCERRRAIRRRFPSLPFRGDLLHVFCFARRRRRRGRGRCRDR